MTVIYSLSTTPYFAKNPNGVFSIDRFELYTAALSSLTRRKAGNTTIMNCDTRGAEYFHKIEFTGNQNRPCLWSELKTIIPDDLEGINPQMFWAAGKLFALQATSCPVLMLDTDFIAWQLPELKTLTVAHREDLSPNIYPDISHLNMKPGYIFKPFDYSIRPLNTAFIYMNNEDFKQYYIDESMEFMKSAVDCDNYLTYMVYAEQRLLAMLAAYKNIKVDTILDYPNLHEQKRYTHTWGAKQIMRDIPEECERFCEKCRNRIKKDFPEWEYIIELIEGHSK